MMLSLEDRKRRNPPNDGLVSLIFSRLAAILAIDQAEELKKQHLLTQSEANEVESDALQRAAAQESYRLTWNQSRRIYELQHASLSTHDRPALVGAAGIALSPVHKKHQGTLHITVSTPSSGKSTCQPPTIIVTTPVPSNSVEGASRAPSPRTSTLPLTDSDEPLASLDLGTMTLSISAAATISAIPSLYAIDSLIAAMLAVAVSDEATNPVLADMPLNRNIQNHPQYHPPLYKGKLVATFAEREDALQGEELVSRIKSASESDSNTNTNTNTDANTRPSLLHFWRKSNPRSSKQKSKSKNKNKNKKIVVEEFDLERYGRYSQNSSREGQKLPGGVRGVLRVLFFALDLVVKGLTVLVKVLAWVLVNMTRCVTSEKF